MSERLGYDAPKLTRDEATELCVYHLRMATCLFQLVPDDNNESLRKEILRQCKSEIDEVDVTPNMLWAATIWKAYEDMKAQD